MTSARTFALLAMLRLPFLTAIAAQTPSAGSDWSWASLRTAPNVDTARVTWLEQHVKPPEANALFHMIDRLSKPEAGQLLAERMYGDGSAGTDRALADSLFARPRSGVAGSVDVAYFVSRLRETVLARARAGGTFATEFSGGRLVVPTVSRRTPSGNGPRFSLRFDTAPAETLLAIISTPDIARAGVVRRISQPMFDQLIAHRSQSFYPLPWSRELMAANLARAASTDPLDRLYVYAQPRGLLQYGDVSAYRDRYRANLRALKQNEPAILDYVADTLAPFVPDGYTVDRAVSIYFAGGADGWATGRATAFDLEYFKDDFPRLLNVIVHETYHAAQTAVAARSTRRMRLMTLADSALGRAATTLLLEGTANFIAPATRRTPDEVLTKAREGERLVMRVFEATSAKVDRDAMQHALDTGVAGGGPFYWLGALMSGAIVDAFGPKALAKTLEGTGADFIAEYVRATEQRPAAPRFLTPEILAAIRRLRT